MISFFNKYLKISNSSRIQRPKILWYSQIRKTQQVLKFQNDHFQKLKFSAPNIISHSRFKLFYNNLLFYQTQWPIIQTGGKGNNHWKENWNFSTLKLNFIRFEGISYLSQETSSFVVIFFYSLSFQFSDVLELSELLDSRSTDSNFPSFLQSVTREGFFFIIRLDIPARSRTSKSARNFKFQLFRPIEPSRPFPSVRSCWSRRHSCIILSRS